MKIDYGYKCVNGAYHTGLCGPECWNGHPNAMPNEMFLGSERQKEVIREIWCHEAMNVGFGMEQAWFLYDNL